MHGHNPIHRDESRHDDARKQHRRDGVADTPRDARHRRGEDGRRRRLKLQDHRQGQVDPERQLGLIALGERWGNSGMARALIVEVAVLLRPELAIDCAAFKQHMVRRDIHDPAAVQNQGQIALGQR